MGGSMIELLLVIIIIVLLKLLISVDLKRSRIKKMSINGIVIEQFKLLSLDSWVQRRVGLLNCVSLKEGEGLFFPKTSKIHTEGMCFPIDVIYLDKNHIVKELKTSISDGLKSVETSFSAKSVIELGEGEILRLNLSLGDLVEVVK